VHLRDAISESLSGCDIKGDPQTGLATGAIALAGPKITFVTLRALTS